MLQQFQAVAITLPGPFPDAIRAGLRNVGEQLKNNATKTAALLVPHLGHFDSTVVAEVLGEEASKALMKHRTIQIAEGITLSLHSPETIQGHFDELLIVYVSISQIEKSLRNTYGFRSVTYVPWLAKERDFFIDKYQATTIQVEDPRSEEDKKIVDDL